MTLFHPHVAARPTQARILSGTNPTGQGGAPHYFFPPVRGGARTTALAGRALRAEAGARRQPAHIEVLSMAEDRLPPLDIDSTLDLVLLVKFSRTIADLGVTGWWVYGFCSVHGERQEPIFEDMPPPEAKMGCRLCYRAGVTRVFRIEDIREL